jgi:nucleotide-binding universal stress UspA family protein
MELEADDVAMGGGAAGPSAALVLGRARRRIVVTITVPVVIYGAHAAAAPRASPAVVTEPR